MGVRQDSRLCLFSRSSFCMGVLSKWRAWNAPSALRGRVLSHLIPVPSPPYLTNPMHLASSSRLEANLRPFRAHICASSTLGKTFPPLPPLIDEVVGPLRCRHLLGPLWLTAHYNFSALQFLCLAKTHVLASCKQGPSRDLSYAPFFSMDAGRTSSGEHPS